MTDHKKRALIVDDVQNDSCPGGTLAVEHGDEVVAPLNKQPEFAFPDPVIEAYLKDIDRTLIRDNLRLTVTERFERLMSLQQFADDLRAAGKHPTRS